MVWVAGQIFADAGYECVITSGIEGKHGYSSEHFKGDAVDFRTRHLPDRDTAREITLKLASALGDDFDVVLESNHIHVEYDPKSPI